MRGCFNFTKHHFFPLASQDQQRAREQDSVADARGVKKVSVGWANLTKNIFWFHTSLYQTIPTNDSNKVRQDPTCRPTTLSNGLSKQQFVGLGIQWYIYV